MNFCHSCGTEIVKGEFNFCSICGTPLKKDEDETFSYGVKAEPKDTNIDIVDSTKIIPRINISDMLYAFRRDIVEFFVPDGVTSVGSYAFYGCENLESVMISSSVVDIGYHIFKKCTALRKITVSRKNNNYKEIDGNLYTKDGKTLIYYANGKNDTSFSIPEGVERISCNAFSGCKKLVKIFIPDSVSNVDVSAFSDCINLANIFVSENNSFFKDINGVLYTKDGKTIIKYPTGKTDKQFRIPESVTRIYNYAFSQSLNISMVTISNNIFEIGQGAFEGCSNLLIYCETAVRLPTWDIDWNCSNCPVLWEYKKGI